MAQESLLDKLLKTGYPLTQYLSRQQQFVKVHHSTTSNATTTSPMPTTNVACKRKAPAPPLANCFNVPDTLDPLAPDFNDDQNEIHSDPDENIVQDNPADDVARNAAIDDDATQNYDETVLLKTINDQISDTDEHFSSLIQRSSTILFEFTPSPHETNSPLRNAIQNGLDTINGRM